MYQAFKATIDESGNIRLSESIQLSAVHHALVIVLGDTRTGLDEAALLSEESLAQDWNRPEEDAAWAYLQPGHDKDANEADPTP